MLFPGEIATVSLGEPVKNCFSVPYSLMDFMKTIFIGFQSSMFWRPMSQVLSSKLGSQVWDTLFLREKPTVVTFHLLLYCGSKGGFHIEILSLPLLMIYLFFYLLMILVGSCPIHLVYRIYPASFHISFRRSCSV